VNILLPYWRGVPDRCFYQEFQLGIAAALRDSGHQVFSFPFAERAPLELAEAKQFYRQITDARIDMVLDLACWGFGLSLVRLPAVEGVADLLYDRFGISYLAWLFDHPFNQQLVGAMAKRHYVLYPDRGHAQQVRLIYPTLRVTGEIFAPPAVRLESDFSVSNGTVSRPIDVLYVGNLEVQALDREKWRNPSNEQRPPFFDPGFCDALADAMLSVPDRSLHFCLQDAMAMLDKAPGTFNVRAHVSLVENFLRHLHRRNMVVALARSGVRMQVVGKGWNLVGLPANVTVMASTDYEGIFRLAAQAKICLDVSTYLNGANDRVFSYALNRSVCFTNAAGYLRDAMGEEGGMRFYTVGNIDGLCAEVKALLAKPHEFRDLGERAAQTVRSAHTWRQRIGSVLASVTH
jgi:hypothetical protein